jgi:hypothetical protein
VEQRNIDSSRENAAIPLQFGSRVVRAFCRLYPGDFQLGQRPRRAHLPTRSSSYFLTHAGATSGRSHGRHHSNRSARAAVISATAAAMLSALKGDVKDGATPERPQSPPISPQDHQLVPVRGIATKVVDRVKTLVEAFHIFPQPVRQLDLPRLITLLFVVMCVTIILSISTDSEPLNLSTALTASNPLGPSTGAISWPLAPGAWIPWPASTPSRSPGGSSGSRDEIAALLVRARTYLSDGDISAALKVLQRAVELGDPQAALALGGTYDPVVLKRLGLINFRADPEQARLWYQRAAELGSPDVALRLKQLPDR